MGQKGHQKGEDRWGGGGGDNRGKKEGETGMERRSGKRISGARCKMGGGRIARDTRGEY